MAVDLPRLRTTANAQEPSKSCRDGHLLSFRGLSVFRLLLDYSCSILLWAANDMTVNYEAVLTYKLAAYAACLA